jgi:hypothetical protein
MDFNQPQPRITIELRGGVRLELSVEEAREVLAQLTQVLTAPLVYPYIPQYGTPVWPQEPLKWYVGDPVIPFPGSTISVSSGTSNRDVNALSCLL